MLRTGIRSTLLLALSVTLLGCRDAPLPDTDLEKRLQSYVDNFAGDVGLYVEHLQTGMTVEIMADSVFPTASLIKVPILVALFDQVERGVIGLDDKWTYDESTIYEGDDGLLASFRMGEEVEVSKLAMLMMTTSDNTASLWIQREVGTGTAINEWLAGNGFTSTRMNSRTPGREDDWKKYGWGQTTPREMARLVTMIRDGQAVSPAASEEMYRFMTRAYWDDEALSAIPATVQAASKQGAVNASRSEVVLVNAPSGDYVFCLITKNQEDQSWGADNEGFVLLRKVSRDLWDFFEPQPD